MEYSAAKTKEAAAALQKYLKNSQSSASPKKLSLFDEEGPQDTLYINISTKKYVTDHKSLKPKRIAVPHRLTASDDLLSICLICKDPQRSYKDALLGNGEIPTLKRVIGVSKLKGKFKSYEARRLLRSQYDIFVAEDSVVTTLPKLLGKIFYDSKKVPLSIKTKNAKGEISAAKVKKELDAIVNSTILTIPSGLTFSVKVGALSSTPEQVSENVDAVVKYFTEKIADFDGIRTIQLRTASSPSLPIYIVDKIYDEKKDVAKETKPSKETKAASKRKRSDPEDEEEQSDDKSILAEAWKDILDDDTLNEYKKKYKKTSDAIKAAAASISSEIRN